MDASFTLIRQQATTVSLQPQIVVEPSSEKYFDKMANLLYTAYGENPEENTSFISGEVYAQHHRIFPEGQFIAVDTTTDEVVGLTVSMRTNFDRTNPLLQGWLEATGYG